MAVKICPSCQGKVAESRDTCPHCGYSFSSDDDKKICPECEEEVEANAIECPVCGHEFEVTSPQADNDEQEEAVAEGLECPYCHEHSLIQEGKDLYVCSSCRMRSFGIEEDKNEEEDIDDKTLEENGSTEIENKSEEEKEDVTSDDMKTEEENVVPKKEKVKIKVYGQKNIFLKITAVGAVLLQIATVVMIALHLVNFDRYIRWDINHYYDLYYDIYDIENSLEHVENSLDNVENSLGEQVRYLYIVYNADYGTVNVSSSSNIETETYSGWNDDTTILALKSYEREDFEIRLSATAYSYYGYYFGGWYLNGIRISESNSFTFAMTKDSPTLVANFYYQ